MFFGSFSVNVARVPGTTEIDAVKKPLALPRTKTLQTRSPRRQQQHGRTLFAFFPNEQRPSPASLRFGGTVARTPHRRPPTNLALLDRKAPLTPVARPHDRAAFPLMIPPTSLPLAVAGVAAKDTRTSFHVSRTATYHRSTNRARLEHGGLSYHLVSIRLLERSRLRPRKPDDWAYTGERHGQESRRCCGIRAKRILAQRGAEPAGQHDG